MAPVASELPARVRVAVAPDAAVLRETVPSDFPPAVNNTAPPGTAVFACPECTVAVRTVEAVEAMVAGLAVSVVDVATGVARVIVKAAEVEAVNALLPL